MPSYRLEISPNNRAGCKDTVCKKEGTKITKGEIRFGTWVEIEDHGSWSWKHWGCISGAQLVNIQDAIRVNDDEYDFDQIDGYDELNDSPDHQAKIRKAVEQGHVALEDFKGDPEKCKPGEKGIHLTAKQKEKKEREAAAGADTGGDSPKKTKGKSQAKRGRAKDADEEDEDEDVKPKAKKARKPAKVDAGETTTKPTRGRKLASKVSTPPESDVEVEEEEEEKPAPAKKGRKPSKKKAKEEAEEKPEEEEPAPKAAVAKRGRGRQSKAAEEVKAPAPVRKSRRSSDKTAVESEPEPEVEQEEQEEEIEPKPKGRRGRPRKST